MQFVRPFHGILILLSLAFGFTMPVVSAKAETLQNQVNRLAVLSLHYGVNQFEVGGRTILITRGDFNTETASGGDAYAVMIHEKAATNPDDWKMARYEGPPFNKMLTITAPHTGEDSIVSVRFMVPKSSPNGKASDLYLLKAEKIFPANMQSLSESHEVIFTLYKLWRSYDFGIFYLHEIVQQHSRTEYCNADWAIFKELAVSLPDDSGQYECAPVQK